MKRSTPQPPRRRALSAAQFERVAKALADPRRMALLEAIAGEPDCPCQHLRREFPVSKATISHHIKALVRAGLVDAYREGQFLHCEVRREVLAAYAVELMRRVARHRRGRSRAPAPRAARRSR